MVPGWTQQWPFSRSLKRTWRPPNTGGRFLHKMALLAFPCSSYLKKLVYGAVNKRELWLVFCSHAPLMCELCSVREAASQVPALTCWLKACVSTRSLVILVYAELWEALRWAVHTTSSHSIFYSLLFWYFPQADLISCTAFIYWASAVKQTLCQPCISIILCSLPTCPLR